MEVAELLFARGYSMPRIGRVINHDHTTVVFYLGTGKKKPSKLVWRAPKIRGLKWIKPKKAVAPKVYVRPYAGADMTDYRWREVQT